MTLNSTIRPMRDGGTLFEILLVAALIGWPAALAIPAFKRIQRRVANGRFVSDRRTLRPAFERGALKNPDWPASSAAGEVPAGLRGELSASVGTRRHAHGGRWESTRNQRGITAAIGTSPGTADDQQ